MSLGSMVCFPLPPSKSSDTRPERKPVIFPSRKTRLAVDDDVFHPRPPVDSAIRACRSLGTLPGRIWRCRPSCLRPAVPRSVRPIRSAGLAVSFSMACSSSNCLVSLTKRRKNHEAHVYAPRKSVSGERSVHAEGRGVRAYGAQRMEEGVAKLFLGVGVAEDHRVLDLLDFAGKDVHDGIPTVLPIAGEVGDALAHGNLGTRGGNGTGTRSPSRRARSSL